MKRSIMLLAATALLPLSSPVSAQDVRTEPVELAGGMTAEVLTGSITGYESVDYTFNGTEGQLLTVALATNNLATYFNLWQPGADTATHIGSSAGDEFMGRLQADGSYRIQVYMMRSAARRGERASYTITLASEGGPGPIAPDYADGMSGGPDFWEVSNLSAGDILNLRFGPSTRTRVVSRLNAGEVFRNLGCAMANGQRWCRLGPLTDGPPDGWAHGNYLREGNPSLR